MLRGDANCDAVVTAADATYLVEILDGAVPLLCLGADADANLMIDESDLAAAIGTVFGDHVGQ